MLSVRRLGPLVLLALFPLGPARAESDGEDSTRMILLPGGIANAAGRTAYLANATGGIDAVDLPTGALLWQTYEAQRPLLLSGDRLVTQAGVKRNRLRILVFDVRQPDKCVLESDPIVFPPWVVTGESPGRSFALRARVEQNQLLLSWEAKGWLREARTALEQGRPPDHQAAGVARIDLETGRVVMGPAEKAAPAAEVFPDELDKLAVRWHGVVGDAHKAVVLEEYGPVQRLVLSSWDPDTQEEDDPVELLRGRRLLVQTTFDGRYLCLRDAIPNPDVGLPPSERMKYNWSVVSPETGREIGHVSCEPGTEAVLVLGRRVYCLVGGPIHTTPREPSVQARMFQAIDFKTGKKLWEHAVEGRRLAPPVVPRGAFPATKAETRSPQPETNPHSETGKSK
jgi:hypothetical protein